MSRTTTVTRPYSAYVGTQTPGLTSQMQPIPGKTQVKNSAGGFAFKLDEWDVLDRFLILGTQGGTYYASENKLTTKNADAVIALIKKDGVRVVSRVVEFSEANRAPKTDPLLFVLALAITEGNPETKRAVIAALPKVARIGTHLFTFIEYADSLRGWGRVLRDAVSNWYTSQEPGRLAYGVIKYQSRNGWSHRDALRLSHAKATGLHNDVLNWAVRGWDSIGEVEHPEKVLRQIWAYEAMKKAKSPSEAAALIHEYKLPRECVPTEFLKSNLVWKALLEDMPMTAMVRNLATMTRNGTITPMSDAAVKIATDLRNTEKLRKSRIHPIQLLSAYRTYSSGKGVRSQGASFTPDTHILSALNEAFYDSFGNVEPTGKRLLLGLDISGSMYSGEIAGIPGLTPAEAEGTMAMVTARSEWSNGSIAYPMYKMIGFDTKIVELQITPKDSLTNITTAMRRYSSYSGTNISKAVEYALVNNLPIDAFIIYTDNEGWAGNGHPSQWMDKYRQKTGIAAKAVYVAFTATEFSQANPDSKLEMNVVGFDASAPSLIRSFIAE